MASVQVVGSFTKKFSVYTYLNLSDQQQQQKTQHNNVKSTLLMTNHLATEGTSLPSFFTTSPFPPQPRPLYLLSCCLLTCIPWINVLFPRKIAPGSCSLAATDRLNSGRWVHWWLGVGSHKWQKAHLDCRVFKPQRFTRSTSHPWESVT